MFALAFLQVSAQNFASDCFVRSNTNVGNEGSTEVSHLEDLKDSFKSGMKLYSIRGCENSNNQLTGITFNIRSTDEEELTLEEFGKMTGTCTTLLIADDDYVNEFAVSFTNTKIEYISIALNSLNYDFWGTKTIAGSE